MQQEVIKDIEGIGKVLFVKSKKAKHIGISVKKDCIVRVAIPKNSSMKEALAFVELKKNLIISHLQKIKKQKKENTLINPSEVFKTKFHEITFVPEERENISMRFEESNATIYYPEAIKNEDPRLQKIFKQMIAEVFREEAKQFLPGRLDELAKKHGFKYNQLRIKNIKSRWGSCSSLNNINLSLHLMNLPYHLIDVVILHELCHLKYPNHGKEFHTLLENLCPNIRQYEKEMKQQKILFK